jgi:hypothetical protein
MRMLSRQEDSESLDLIFTVLKLMQSLVDKVSSAARACRVRAVV